MSLSYPLSSLIHSTTCPRNDKREKAIAFNLSPVSLSISISNGFPFKAQRQRVPGKDSILKEEIDIEMHFRTRNEIRGLLL
jgi:hypothetical protein